MSNNQYIQIAKFNLKTGISEEEFLNIEKEVRAVISVQAGFLGRDLYKDETGSWLIFIKWENKESANEWSATFKTLKEGQAFIDTMDFSTARQEQFTGVEL